MKNADTSKRNARPAAGWLKKNARRLVLNAARIFGAVILLYLVGRAAEYMVDRTLRGIFMGRAG